MILSVESEQLPAVVNFCFQMNRAFPNPENILDCVSRIANIKIDTFMLVNEIQLPAVLEIRFFHVDHGLTEIGEGK